MGRGQGFVGVVADVEIVVFPNAGKGWGLGARGDKGLWRGSLTGRGRVCAGGSGGGRCGDCGVLHAGEG